MSAGDWIDVQLRRRGIVDERVLEAMARVPRELFVPQKMGERAYDDSALPLAFGQTVSQPFIVALICQGLALEGGERVLDVGTGSGYQAAVLAELAAEVHSIESIPELASRAHATLVESGYSNVRVYAGDGALGLEDLAPFDGIAVAAASADMPTALWEQLRQRGRIALPLGERHNQRLCVLERTPGLPRLLMTRPVRFVPLIGTGDPARPIG